MNTIYCGRTSKEGGTGVNFRATPAGKRTRNEEITKTGNGEKEGVCDTKATTKECKSKQVKGEMK